MSVERGAFLILFDEAQRASFLREVRSIEDGFSDALSHADWPVRQWEVCGLIFDPDTITHWALARRGRRVATGKVRIEFSYVTPANVSLNTIEEQISSQVKRYIVRARSGAGGRVPPATWEALKGVLRSRNPDSLAQLERLESIRDRGGSVIDHPDIEIISQERDATGLLLDMFDGTHKLRKRTLERWAVPSGRPLRSFLDGLEGVRTIEDQLIARDASVFPESDQVRYHAVGGVFGVGKRTLEVFNVNRTSIESLLGVDLLYHNEEFNAWTLVQYKLMEHESTNEDSAAVYRPDRSLEAELRRMKEFRARVVDTWDLKDGQAAYRLCCDGFYIKFCSRIQFDLHSSTLLPGMYVPRQLLECLLVDDRLKGPRDGRMIPDKNVVRRINNTLFAQLVHEAWIGTRGVSSEEIGNIVRERLDAGQSIVLGVGRAEGRAADLKATKEQLGL